jgi:hypothetical protein
MRDRAQYGSTPQAAALRSLAILNLLSLLPALLTGPA